MNIAIYDMTSLRYRWSVNHDALTLLSASGEMLAKVEVPEGTSEREAVFSVLDYALAATRVKRVNPDGTKTIKRLALYNPTTAQISIGGVPSTKVFTDRKPLAIEVEGTLGNLQDGVLSVNGRELQILMPDYASVKEAFKAYS